MDFSGVYERYRKNRLILFGRDSACLAALGSRLSSCSRRAAVLWALGGAVRPVRALAAYFPGDDRFDAAIALSRLWAEGEVKMPAARHAILCVHSAAKETFDPVARALCHAVGQACSCVHAQRHALGLAVYELTAIVRLHPEGWEDAVAVAIDGYMDMLTRAEGEAQLPRRWADFLK